MQSNGNSDNHSLELMDLAQQSEWKEILFNIVKKEKMNPWNIDISLLSESFMKRINEMRKFDFRIPANAILAASIMLRFKSDAWILNQELDLMEPIYIPDSIVSEPIFPTLEPMLRVTKRKVSLEELFDAIEDIIVKEKKNVSKKRVAINAIPQPLIDLMKKDEENFEKKLEEVYERIKETVDKDKLTVFSNLIDDRKPDEVIGSFVPMLHLANKQRIDVWQEETFGEIFIQLPEEKK